MHEAHALQSSRLHEIKEEQMRAANHAGKRIMPMERWAKTQFYFLEIMRRRKTTKRNQRTKSIWIPWVFSFARE